MRDQAYLANLISRIDCRGYKAYKDLAGAYEFGFFRLYIDHVQGDPFAAPTKIRIRVPMTGAAIPESPLANAIRRLALGDFLIRRIHRAIRDVCKGSRGIGKSGLVTIDRGGQEVLERTALEIQPDWVEARLEVGLPARGRTILGHHAREMLCGEIPGIAGKAMLWSTIDAERAIRFVDCVENQEHLRAQLSERGLIAFIADGALLPRASGISDRPLQDAATVAFRSPVSLRVTLNLLHPSTENGGTTITGMGIPRGITLLVGGGYHGKSTVLKALERCVYPHIPGDGREYVVVDPDVVKIRAEDGRRVERVDISGFIDNLPLGRDTRSFSTEDASGSTSQAANILEAIEMGARGLLLDEDSSATNFMIRDARMQALIRKEHEPITPFLDRVRELHERAGVSTVMVLGGSGDYFEVADHVIAMRDYLPAVVTERAKIIAHENATRRVREVGRPMNIELSRVPLARGFNASRGRREIKIDARSISQIGYGTQTIELRDVDQLVDLSQTRAIGFAVHLAAQRFVDDRACLAEVIDRLMLFFDENGLDPLDPYYRPGSHPGAFARPRKYEIAAAINRLRSLRIKNMAGS